MPFQRVFLNRKKRQRVKEIRDKESEMREEPKKHHGRQETGNQRERENTQDWGIRKIFSGRVRQAMSGDPKEP